MNRIKWNNSLRKIKRLKKMQVNPYWSSLLLCSFNGTLIKRIEQIHTDLNLRLSFKSVLSPLANGVCYLFVICFPLQRRILKATNLLFIKIPISFTSFDNRCQIDLIHCCYSFKIPVLSIISRFDSSSL